MAVAVGVEVGVAVGVEVGVEVGVTVGVTVGVWVPVGVAVGVLVIVGAGVTWAWAGNSPTSTSGLLHFPGTSALAATTPLEAANVRNN